MRPCCRIVLLILLALTTISAAQTQPPAKASPAASAKDWIKRSNENAQILLKVQAKFAPEFAARQGVEGLDDQVTQFPPNRREQVKGDTRAAITQLEKILATEKDPLVRQDLEIMIQAAQRFVRGQEITEKYDMPYFNLPQLLFSGIRALLDDQVPENRRTAALVRLRKYAGMEPGYQPITEQAKARTVEWTKPGQLPPAKVEVETNLARADFFINGIEQLFQKYKIEGYQEPYAKLKQQLADYNAWVKQEILPKARTDFRLPAEEYAFGLQQIGVDIPPEQLAAMAHKSFTEYQQAMQEVAAKIAKRRGLKSTDYRDVIREPKKEPTRGRSDPAQVQRDAGEH
jgi:hypothetical protein